MRRHMCAKLEKRTWAKPKRRMSISLRTILLSLQIAIRMLYSNTIDYIVRKQVALIVNSHAAKLMLLYEISVTKRKKS